MRKATKVELSVYGGADAMLKAALATSVPALFGQTLPSGCEKPSQSLARKALASGANAKVNIPSSRSGVNTVPALICAYAMEALDLATDLIGAGVDPNQVWQVDRVPHTPLWAAAKNRAISDEACLDLMQAGADPWAPCSTAACANGNGMHARGQAPAVQWFMFHGRVDCLMAALDKPNMDGMASLLRDMSEISMWSKPAMRAFAEHPSMQQDSYSKRFGEEIAKMADAGRMDAGEMLSLHDRAGLRACVEQSAPVQEKSMRHRL
jgi:hypothetical protein